MKNLVKKELPGPGAYDIGFKDELKLLDQKLQIRYHLGPFSSTEKRFKDRPSPTAQAGTNLD